MNTMLLRIIFYSLLHAFTIACLFVASIVSQGGLLAESGPWPLQALSSFTAAIVQILGFPGFYTCAILGPACSNSVEWALLAANSLLYGAALALFVRKQSSLASGGLHDH